MLITKLALVSEKYYFRGNNASKNYLNLSKDNAKLSYFSNIQVGECIESCNDLHSVIKGLRGGKMPKVVRYCKD
jgi:hypothetical protein